MIRLCLILQLFSISFWLYPGTQATSRIENGTLSFEQPSLVIGLVFNSTIGAMNISASNLSLSNSTNFDSVCTVLNVNATLNTSVISPEHSLILSVSDSNDIRIALGDIPNCFVSSLTTYLRVPPDFVPDFSAQTIYSLVPIPDTFPPSLTSATVNLKTGVIILEFSEITLPNTFNLSLLSLSDQSSPNPPSSVPLSDLVDIMSGVGATDSYNFILEVSQLSFVDQFCPSSTCFLHLAVGSIIQDVFGNILRTFSEVIQSTIFTQFTSSFFSATFTSTSISLTLSNMTIQPPLERSGDVTGFLVYIFLMQVDYYDESCDFPIAYEFQRRVGSTAFNSSLNIISSLPPCLNSTEYSCYATQELSIVVNISPGFTFRRALITQYPGTHFSVSATDSSADNYNDILGFQFQIQCPGRRRKRGVAPSPEGNRAIVSWQVDPSFCDTHQLTLYYGSRSSNLFAYVDLDRNATCVEQFAQIYTTRDRTFIIPHIRITPYATQNLVPPNSCIDLRLELLSEHVPFFTLATDRPVISRISENGGSNDVSIEWIGFSKPGFSIDFYNIFIFPIYALEYNGVSCSNVDFQTTIEDFTFSPTEYYRHGVSPPRDDFNFACPPPSGLALPYSCYSVSGQEVMFTNTYTYAQGIVVEAVTREQSTNLVERIRSYPFNYTTYTLDLGRSGTNYQQYTWDSGFCHTFNSFIFTHSTFIHNQLNQLFYNSSVYPCNDGMGIDLRLIDDQNYVVSSNYITDVVTTSGTVCLLGYESLPRAFTVFLTEQPIDVVEFRYINYGTILTTIQVNEGYFNPVDIYTIPFQVSSLSGGNMGDLCPTVSSNIPSYSVDCISNFNISSMSNLVCANTNNYFCTSVSNTINITLSVFPGFEPIIRAATGGNEFSEMPNVESIPFLPLISTQLRQLHAQEYTSRDLETANSVRLQWNTDFYCAPDSYISFSATIQGGLVVPKRRRRWGLPITNPVATIPCSTGSYVYTDLNFDTSYAIMGDVFFNSTGFFPACPVVRIPFSSIRTLPLFNPIQILDFSSIQVSWNAISNATGYTLLAIPTQFTEFNQSIGETFTPNTHPQTIQNLNIPNLTLFFEMCLNSNPNITCSKASTSELSAVISTIPGFSYILGLVFNANNEIVSIPLEQYNPNTLISNQIAVSGFNNFYSYSFNESSCSPSTRVVFYYTESNAMSFPVNPCNISRSRIDLTAVFDQLPQPQILLIFPFTNFTFPDFNLTSPPPISVGVFISGQLTFAPISASPMITSVTQPADISSSIYQATWTPSPPLPLQQQFETYVLYALPFSNSFLYADGACPTNVQFGRGGLISILQPTTRDPLTDVCPSLNGELYFCGEFSSLSAQLSALTLLNYVFEVEARYSGGLRTSNYTSSVAATQDMSSLAISYQVTPVTIIIAWNSQVSFCSDSQLHFIARISNSQEDEELINLPFGVAAACSAGTVTLQSLLPLTTYFIEYILLFDVSGVPQGTEKCVQTEIPLSLSPSPTTTSFCTPTNPCGFGLCSEGFSNSSYHCDCSSGFRFDSITCVDIDECSITPAVCQNSACLNTIGNFTCTCYEGYEMVVETCEDINECEIASNCINGNCSNLLPPIGFECTCDSGFEGASCSIPVEIPSCPSITEANTLGDPVTFHVTELRTVATVSCSLINIELFGNVTRFCNSEGEWGPVDYTGCQRITFMSIQATTTLSETRVLTPMESEVLSDELVMATNTSNGPLFPGEVFVASQAVNAITQSLNSLSQDANALIESLTNVQDNMLEVTSNILSEENTGAFGSVSENEAEMQIINLIEAIDDIGILIGSVAQENQTRVMSQPAAALIVTRVDDVTEPLVLGSNLSMTAGPGASALVAARTSVSIPPSVFQSSNESIAVSVSLFPTLPRLLMNIRVNSTDPNAPDTSTASNTLGSSLVSVNLFTSSGVRITQLPEPINLTLTLLNDTLLINNATLRSDLFCISSQILSQGFTFDDVTLSNPKDVPPGPAICTATHLTHFGILVSVSSIFSFCTPTDPCGSGLCSEGFSNSTYHCDCIAGFRFDGITCVDIDECSLTPTVCPNGACTNTIGSSICTCFEGFAMVNGICEDINECEIASNCINGNCTNLFPPVGFECTCNSGFGGSSCIIPVEIPSCPSITEANTLGDPVTFPVTELRTVATVSCSLINIELFGNVTRFCNSEGEWGPVDYTGCQRIIFVSIQATNTMSETRVLTPMESEMLSDTLVTATNTSNGPLFPGEVFVASQAVNVITQSLTNLSQDANALRESLANVQDNVVEATSNILSEENSPAFESVSENEAEMQIISLVEAIEDIGILIGSVAQENQTIVVEISRPAAALIVTLVNDVTEPLVLGSNLSMTAGPGASALVAARTSVSIPPSVFQSSNESIAVSVSLFPTVQTLLMNIRVNTTDPNAPDTTTASNALTSSLASVNLFTSSGVRITQLPEPINLTFALLNDTPLINNETLRSDLFCVSSQILSQGFNFDYVFLSNPNDVPPGPAICTATHLTHFGVLVSVTTQNLSQAEITALEVLTYITCVASIICLLLSIAAYVFLWFKTRNKQENLFQKDATILHMNFAIALLLALIFFLSSTRGFGHRGWCTAILLIQYYFWLSVFTSSLSIGIYLLIKIFAWSSQRRVWYYLVLLAWTLPLPLIIIVPSITREYIINEAEMVCWFSKEPNFANLSFIIPMIVITLTNLIILIITAVVLFRISKGNKGMVVQMKGILIASFTLSPILGIPWLFSIAASTPTSAVSFIFTIVLGLQGVLFAILYPLRTPEIFEYFFRCKSKNAMPSTKLSTSGASHPTRSTPTAIKFRVKRHNATNTTSEVESSKHDSLKKEIPLDEIKSVPSEGASTDFVSEPANPSGNTYTVLTDLSKNEPEAHF